MSDGRICIQQKSNRYEKTPWRLTPNDSLALVKKRAGLGVGWVD
ncbi:MAG: hypothetical protein RL077_5006 [Verrucomicrobiota bacterium]